MHSTLISLSPGLVAQAGRALQALASSLNGVYQRWWQARQARATARVLQSLDDGQLHDLGLDRSELLSAAAELHGLAERQRRHTLFGAPPPRAGALNPPF